MGLERMIDSVFCVIIFILFALSGVIANICWAALLPLWFIGQIDLYRKYAKTVTEMWWRVAIFIPIHWAGCTVEYYTTDAVEEKIGNESGIILANHRYSVDWMLDWIVAEQYDMLGQCKAFIKASVAKYPIIGWSMWFNEFVFLSRGGGKDMSKIKNSIRHLKEYSEPCWLLLYPEGTRFNTKKHEESMKFAIERNLPKLNYHLLPRPTGFNEIVSNLSGSNVKAVYDATFLIKDDFDVPISNWLRRKPTPIKVCITRIELDSIPTDTQKSKEYIYKHFQQKDQLMDLMVKNPLAASYSLPETNLYKTEMKLRSKPTPMRPLYTTIFWFCVIILPILNYIYKIIMTSFTGFLVVLVVIIGLNLAVTLILESFHKKPSSYGLKKQ